MRRFPLLLLVLLAVTLLGAACGGDDDGGDAADESTEEVDDANEGEDTEVEDGDEAEEEDAEEDDASASSAACDLVTEADIEEAIPDADVTQQEGATDDTCSYGGSSLPLTIVTVTIQRDALAGSADFEEVIEQLGGVIEGDVEEVDDVGDAAVSITNPVPILYVAIGDDLLAISVIAGDDPEAGLEVEIDLAKTAISRL